MAYATALSVSESHHQRMHWLSEQVLNCSGLPAVHVRPTLFLDYPLFTTVAARSIADSGTIRLPFGTGRTSPVTTDDVARVVATVLADPGPHIGQVLELTGPRSQDMNGVAEGYARARCADRLPTSTSRNTYGPSKCSHVPGSDRTPTSTWLPWPGYVARIGMTA